MLMPSLQKFTKKFIVLLISETISRWQQDEFVEEQLTLYSAEEFFTHVVFEWAFKK